MIKIGGHGNMNSYPECLDFRINVHVHWNNSVSCCLSQLN